MGEQFVAKETIAEALATPATEEKGSLFYDMPGEAALTAARPSAAVSISRRFTPQVPTTVVASMKVRISTAVGAGIRYTRPADRVRRALPSV